MNKHKVFTSLRKKSLLAALTYSNKIFYFEHYRADVKGTKQSCIEVTTPMSAEELLSWLESLSLIEDTEIYDVVEV